MSIGPQIPPHILAQLKGSIDDGEQGPSLTEADPIPSHQQTPETKFRVHDDDDAGPHPNVEPSDEDEDDIGPQPLAGVQQEQPDPVREFMEKEEKRRKAAEDALKPTAPKREEWMLVPPTTSSLLGNLDPTKLKGRQFSRGTTTHVDNDMTLWTETPAERQQRLADEVQGKKRRVTDAPLEDEEELERKRRRKEGEEVVRKNVEDYTRKRRGPALVDQHASTMDKKSSEKERWEHSRDMAIGGRLMDDGKRNKLLKDAQGLGDRFNSGKSGGFL